MASFPPNDQSCNDEAMTRQELLDLYFVDARAKLIDLAAFLDRLERAEGASDFRLEAFQKALVALSQGSSGRAARVLLAFSDPTETPIERAPGKGACGAFNPAI
jgi:hypothetical protein